jgi:uncharacterized membrane protein YuzA (DUF378 family)
MMKGMKMCGIHKAAMVLVLVGALNWGLVGILKMNLVMTLLGAWPLAERAVYVLVGLSAVVLCFAGQCCAKCEACGAEMGGDKKPAAPQPKM